MKCRVGGFLVAAERGAKIAVVGEILRCVEQVRSPALREAVGDEMHAAGIGLGAEGADEVGVGRDVVQTVEGDRAAFAVAVGDEVSGAVCSFGPKAIDQVDCRTSMYVERAPKQ